MGVGYQPLPKESDDTAHFDEHARSGHHPISFLKSQKIFLSLAVLLFFSVAVNVGLVIREAQFSLRNGHACTSTYANIEENTVDRVILPDIKYIDDENLNATTAAWEVLSGDPGVVALPDEFVASKKLPTAMRYPWDDSKGVYLLQGFHNLHCIRTIYRAIVRYHLGQPQRIALSHVLHCLDELRQDVICHADDTPRYAGNQDPPGTGRGQTRKCRDWNSLSKWALENTACFRHEDETPDAMVNRFKFCPNGDKPWLAHQGSHGTQE